MSHINGSYPHFAFFESKHKDLGLSATPLHEIKTLWVKTKYREGWGIKISRLVRDLWREIQIAREDISWLKSRFKRSAKWLADENIDLSIIEWMRSEGMNVRTANELGFQGKDDREIFALARKLNRMIITSDKDFWDDSKFPIDMSPGIIIISQDVSDREIALELLNLREVIWPYGEVWDKSKIKLEGSGKIWVKSRARDTGKTTTTVYWITKHKVYERVGE